MPLTSYKPRGGFSWAVVFATALLFPCSGCLLFAPIRLAGKVTKTAVSTTGTVAGAAISTTGAVAGAAVSATTTVASVAVDVAGTTISAAASLAKAGFVVFINTGGGPALQVPHVHGMLLAAAIQGSRVALDSHSAKILRGKKQIDVPQDRWAATYLEDGDVVVLEKSGKE